MKTNTKNVKKFVARPALKQPSLFDQPVVSTKPVEPALRSRIRITHARKQLKEQNWATVVSSVRAWRSSGATVQTIVANIGHTYGLSVSKNTVGRIINREGFYRSYKG